MIGTNETNDRLTDKMRRAIPIIACAKTVRQGVLECAGSGVVTEDTFYKRWLRKVTFRDALTQAREEHFGELRERVRSTLIFAAEDAAMELTRIAREGQKRSGQLRAIEDIFIAIGLEEFRRGAGTPLHKSKAASIEEKQERFKDLLERMLEERLRLLDGVKKE